MSTVELERSPSIGALYRRAALGLVIRRSGDTLPDRTFVLREVSVDRAHLAAYDRVCGFRLRDRLPATYPHVLAFPLALELMSAGDFPFPVVGLVHVANRISVLRPLSADDPLDIAVHAEHLRPHERGRQLDVVAVATVDGAEVWRGVSTYLRKEPSAAAGERRERAEPPRATALWRVETSVGPAYADVSGDRNPIHTSRLGARLFGFRRPIAHGMWSKARCLAALDGRLPDQYTVDVSFRSPVLLPATVGFHAAKAGDGGWTLSLHDAKSGRPHLTGAVTPLSSPPT